MAEACGAELAAWLGEVEAHLRTGRPDEGRLVGMQNHIFRNHASVEERCPAAWLAALLLKVASNLGRGAAGLTCARVHAAGCIRDARGYWLLYASARLERAAAEPAEAAAAEGAPLVASLLGLGEARVVERFREAFAPPGRAAEQEL